MIKTKIFEILKELGIEKIKDTSVTLTEDLSLDSLKMVTLLIMIEDSFEIELEESDMDPFRLITVADIICLVEKYTSVKGDKSNE